MQCKKIYIKDSKQYDNYFQGEITIDNVIEMIKINKNLTPKFSQLFIEYVTKLIKKYPNVDLTILTVNLAHIKVIESLNEIKSNYEEGIVAQYDPNVNVIYIEEENHFLDKEEYIKVLTHGINSCFKIRIYYFF